jgi:hypothetical protein
MITLNEPKGVTNIGGAKEYAAKFATGARASTKDLKLRVREKTHIHPAPLKGRPRQVSGCRAPSIVDTHLLSSLPTRQDFLDTRGHQTLENMYALCLLLR